jgi:hypothetical protein
MQWTESLQAREWAMNAKSVTIALLLGLGLLILVGPKLAHSANGTAGVGNCYDDTEVRSTPTVCE